MRRQTTQLVSRQVHVRGQELRVTTENPDAGRPLLLVNGIGATADLFEPVRAHMGDRTTIAFDAPGVGGSPSSTFPRTMRQLAQLVADLVTELGYEHVDVLGLSWGGTVVQELARRFPERVRRLVLVATTPGWLGVPGHPYAMSTLMSPMRYYSKSYLMSIAPTLYGGEIGDHPHLLERQADQRAAQPPSPLGYLHQLAALSGWTSVPWLHQIPQPTLVMSGDDDRLVPSSNAVLLATQIPKARLHIVKGGGHLFLFTRSEETSTIIRGFLDGEPGW